MVNQPLAKRNMKLPFANMRRLYRVKSIYKAKDGGTVSFGLKSKEKILTGQTIGTFQGKKVSHKEMLRRQVGQGGSTRREKRFLLSSSYVRPFRDSSDRRHSIVRDGPSEKREISREPSFQPIFVGFWI